MFKEDLKNYSIQLCLLPIINLDPERLRKFPKPYSKLRPRTLVSPNFHFPFMGHMTVLMEAWYGKEAFSSLTLVPNVLTPSLAYSS